MRISLFWRTFLMIATLIVASVLGTLQLALFVDRSPPEQQLAWEITSVVNLTRSALVSSEGERRRALLDELAREEHVLVTPLEAGDQVEPLGRGPRASALAAKVEQRLRSMLGPHTRLAGKVNGVDGLWVSFDIDGDAYWLLLDPERFRRRIGPDWPLIGLMAVVLSLLGALAISQIVNRPLARLAAALDRLGRGEPPPRLREDLPTEIAKVNRGFNRMASDLAQLDSDRALALAGISHDIRTPLSRLRLEVELSPLTEDDKASMVDDLERIDRIVGQFVEYARAGQVEGARASERIDVAALARSIAAEYRAREHEARVRVELACEAGTEWRGDALELTRVLVNLVENAMRYGRTTPEGWADVRISIARSDAGLRVEVSDHGPGVPPEHLERLLRPFARVGAERSAGGGTGLGLAIVDRIARRYGGDCVLSATSGGGLTVTVRLPDATLRV